MYSGFTSTLPTHAINLLILWQRCLRRKPFTLKCGANLQIGFDIFRYTAINATHFSGVQIGLSVFVGNAFFFTGIEHGIESQRHGLMLNFGQLDLGLIDNRVGVLGSIS